MKSNSNMRDSATIGKNNLLSVMLLHVKDGFMFFFMLHFLQWHG